MMNELNEQQEALLIECLQMMEGGADIETCLARYPQHAQALGPYLELRTQMLVLDRPEPPTVAYAAGRQALLERLVNSPSPEAGRSLVHTFGIRWRMARERLHVLAVGGWNRLESPLARVAAVGALLFLLGGGALGASAAGGFEPARQVLSGLHIAYQPSESDWGEERNPNAEDTLDNADDGIGNASEEADTGMEYADDRASEGKNNASTALPEEIPGVGLCFAESELQDSPNLPDHVLRQVSDLGFCIPEDLLQRSPNGRACIPEGLFQRFPDLGRFLSDDATCGSEEIDEPTETQPAIPTPPGPPTGQPEPTVPAPLGPPAEQPPELPDPSNSPGASNPFLP